MEKLVRFCIYNPFYVLIFVFGMALWGWQSFNTLPIDAVPDITNVQVQVITNINGLVPEEIERKITFPIEAALNGISGVTQLRSTTRLGISHITVVFEEGADIYRARQLVSERLSSIENDLPPGVKPKLGPISTGLGEIFHYTVAVKDKKNGEEGLLQLMEARALQDWFIKPRLLRVKGVTEINTIGGFEKQFHIQPDIDKMNSFGITFAHVAEAIRKNNANEGGGYVQQTATQFLIQANGLLKNIEDIENVPVRVTKSLTTIKVKDIARVKLSTELRNGAALVNGEEAVLGTILMLMGENSRVVANRVAGEVEIIRKNLPPGFDIKPLYNRAEMVNETLFTVEKNLIFGSLLVVVFLLLLVGNIPAALITSAVIPLSLLFTFILMKVKGVSGNLMSLGSLDFGIIIDSAVIVIDGCLRSVSGLRSKLDRKLERDEVKEAVLKATLSVTKPAAFGQLIITLVFFPILMLNGVEGKMFIPMAYTFVFALIGALILSFTFVPAVAGIALSRDLKEKKPFLMKWCEKLLSPLITKSFELKKVIIPTAAVLLLGTFFLFTRMGGEFIPQLDEGSLALDTVRPMSISTDQAVEIQKITDQVLLEFPEVTHVFSRMGSSAIPQDPSGINLGDMFIMLKPRKDWPKVNGKVRTKEEFVNDVKMKVQSEVLGLQFMATQPIQMRFNEMLEGTRADVSIKVFGDDFHTLEKITYEIQNLVRPIKGTGQVQAQVQGRSSLLSLTPDLKKMGQVGFGNSTILAPIAYGFKGTEVGQLFNGVQRFPIVVRLDHDVRDDYHNINDLPVSPEDNDLVLKVDQLADTKFTETFHSIFRENSLRRSAVLIGLKDRDVQSYVKEAQTLVESKVKLPPGYFLEWGGSYKNLQSAVEKLSILVPITLVVIFFVIYSLFKNFIVASLIFFCIPLSLVGGVFALWLRDMPFSISAGVGFIALAGIAVINGVILMGSFNQEKLHDHHGKGMIHKTTMIVLRPILMTALVDAFGFLPMMLSSGLGAEVQRPLATVVVGGIISATLLALFVLPLLYLLLEKKIEKLGLVGGGH